MRNLDKERILKYCPKDGCYFNKPHETEGHVCIVCGRFLRVVSTRTEV